LANKGDLSSYVAYGLGIHSALPFPELVPGEAAADVVIRLATIDPPREVTVERGGFRLNADEAHIVFPGVAEILVRHGREILVEPAAGVDERELRLLILAHALSALLHQRGRLVLHGSSVVVNGGAVVFLGASGDGKSSTAAAFHAQGHGVLADDVTAVQVDDQTRPMIAPGFPQLKVWPQVAAFLGDDPERLPRLYVGGQKRARRVVDGFPQKASPLKRIYVLEAGRRLEIQPLQPPEALWKLVRHSFCVIYPRGAGSAPHFVQCARLAATVKCATIMNKVDAGNTDASYTLDALAQLPQLVEEDLAEDDQVRAAPAHVR
jgi:hypothetical protein